MQIFKPQEYVFNPLPQENPFDIKTFVVGEIYENRTAALPVYSKRGSDGLTEYQRLKGSVIWLERNNLFLVVEVETVRVKETTMQFNADYVNADYGGVLLRIVTAKNGNIGWTGLLFNIQYYFKLLKK